jgi:Flp pilus assembly protein TadD
VRQALSPALLLIFSLASCNKTAQSPPPRYAFARFENLTGDPALDWVARAASEYLSRTLAQSLDGPGLSAAALNRAAGAGFSTDRARATLAGATHLISGYLERTNGNLRLHAVDEDLATHRDARTVTAEAAQPLPALKRLAHEFSPSSAPYLTSNPEALMLYTTAVDRPAIQAVPLLRNAVAADPDFGPAWVGLAELNPTTATVDEALAHNVDPIDKASLQLVKAALENDRPARVAALRTLATLTPADLALRKSLAENETALGQFAQAAADWRKLRDASPSDKDAWNQLGYALAWSGDFNAAIDAETAYSARFPEDPNALDSTGDVYFLYGKFSDAASWYLKANRKNPEFLGGGDLYKAAWAQFRAGDQTKAAATFELFRKARAKQTPAAFALFEGDWLYRTGHEKEAEALLRKAAGDAPPQFASGVWSQLVIWDLLAHNRAAAAKDAAVEATKPPSNVSTIARFAALPSASAAEWQSRAETMIHGAGIEASRRYALALALLLDGKPDLGLLEQTAANAPATDFFLRNLLDRLQHRKPKFEIVPDPLNVNQLSAALDKL